MAAKVLESLVGPAGKTGAGPEARLSDRELEVMRLYGEGWITEEIGDRLHLERFAVAKAAPAGEGGTVTFARSGRSVATDAATSLMDAGEGAGVQMPFGCRMGICQSCVVSLMDGHVRDLRTGQEHEPGTRVQTCISSASGNCVLDI